MSNQECKQMTDELAYQETQRISKGNSECIQKHTEIMDEANRQLLQDLMMEQLETA